MKILFVDILYDYGDSNRGLNQIGQLGFKSSFEKLGHEVVPFYYDHLQVDLENLNTNLLQQADQEKPDLIFFMLFRDQFFPETLEKLKKKFKTVNWFGDDTWRFDSFTKKYAPHFSWSITTDKFSIPKYHGLGVKSVIYSQWASISAPASEFLNLSYDRDISFIGQNHPYRTWFIAQLKKKGWKVDCFGYGWENGILSLEDMQKVFCSSKINLNLSNSTEWDLRYLISHPKALAYALKSPKNMSQIKARNFEINCLGGFQLTDYVPSLEDYLQIGKEVICFRNLNEAIQLIDYYLAQDKEREAIRKFAWENAKENHTYLSRLKKVLEEI
ncbi:MAG: glycosyltransferase [Bdellovibrionales bacterium]|nr:glycosyltransferase [Bdellovibrionales bacterium]